MPKSAGLRPLDQDSVTMNRQTRKQEHSDAYLPAYFVNLAQANGEDVKVVQELQRHATVKMTLEVYTQAVNPAKRQGEVRGILLLESCGPDQDRTDGLFHAITTIAFNLMV